MTLTDTQKNEVTRWIDAGQKLAEIQKRLQTEFGVNLTYMEVRLLVDDLKLVPKDVEPTKPPADLAAPAAPQPPAGRPGSPAPAPAPLGNPNPFPQPESESPAGGNVSIQLDQITRPGALVSGSVRFSDGQTATWYLDQMGRLGLAAAQKGYRPSQADLEEFQLGLERELARVGM